MTELGISHILITAGHLEPHFPERIVYKQLEVGDNSAQMLKPFFDESYEFIEEALTSGGKIVVHCEAGISRSGTIVVAYLMRKNNWSRDEALAFARTKRPKYHPNKGFM